MKRTSPVRVQLEDSGNPEGQKGSGVGRKKPEEVVPIGLAALDRRPSASQPIPRFHSVSVCLGEMLMHMFLPHIYISVMS